MCDLPAERTLDPQPRTANFQSLGGVPTKTNCGNDATPSTTSWFSEFTRMRENKKRIGVATRSVQSVLKEFSAQQGRNHQSSNLLEEKSIFSDFWGENHSKQLWWQFQFPGEGAQAAQRHSSTSLSKESNYRRRQGKCQMSVEKPTSSHIMPILLESIFRFPKDPKVCQRPQASRIDEDPKAAPPHHAKRRA